MKNYALSLYLLAILGAILFLTPPCKKSPPPPLPSEGGSGTLESFDPSKGSGRLIMSEKPESTPIQWPKTYKAPDGVNMITENEDGTGSMTLAWAPKPKPGELAMRGNDDTYSLISLDEAAKRQKKHVITQAELDEVMTIIRDSVNAHNFALDFYQTAIVAFRSTDEQAAIMANIRTVTESGKRLLEFEAKWRKRAEKAKP